MTLRQYDIVKRVAYTPNPSGYYYWSSTYYYDTADFSTPTQAFNRASNVDRLHTIDQVEYVHCVVKEPPGRGNVIATIPYFLTTGMIISGSEPYSLINVLRLRMEYDDGRSSYRYMRAPILNIWQEGSEPSAFLQARAQSFINNQKAISGFPAARNVHGGRCIGGSVPGLLTMWQLRHGTKRRERTY